MKKAPPPSSHAAQHALRSRAGLLQNASEILAVAAGLAAQIGLGANDGSKQFAAKQVKGFLLRLAADPAPVFEGFGGEVVSMKPAAPTQLAFADEDSAAAYALARKHVAEGKPGLFLILGECRTGKTLCFQRIMEAATAPEALYTLPNKAHPVRGMLDLEVQRGSSAVCFDGVRSIPRSVSSMLECFLSQPTWTARRLFSAEPETHSNRLVIFITGGPDLKLSADLTRRVTGTIRMDSTRPWEAGR